MTLNLLPERQCKTCTRQAEWGCDAYETEEIDPWSQQKRWEHGAILPVSIDGIEHYRCPRRPLLDEPDYWRQLLFYYAAYKNGHLPDIGSFSEQSFRAMQLFGVLDDVTRECQEELRQRATEQRNRG